MLGKESVMHITSADDIVSALGGLEQIRMKTFNLLAGAYVHTHSQFLIKYISELEAVYTKYLNNNAGKEDVENVYKKFEEDLYKINKEENPPEYRRDTSKYDNDKYNDQFWVDKRDKRKINIYSVYGDDSKNEVPQWPFFVFKKDLFEKIEKYANNVFQLLDKGNVDDSKSRQNLSIKYMIIRILLNTYIYQDIIKNIEVIKKRIEDVPGLQIDKAIRFLQEFKKVQDFTESILEDNKILHNTDNIKTYLQSIDRRLSLLRMQSYLWYEEHENGNGNGYPDADDINLRQPVLDRISVGNKQLTYEEVMQRDIFTKEDEIEKKLETEATEEERMQKLQKFIEDKMQKLKLSVNSDIDIEFLVSAIYKRFIEMKELEKEKKDNDRDPFLRTLEYIIGEYMELLMTGKIRSNVLEVHKYYINSGLASVDNIAVKVNDVNVYVLHTDNEYNKTGKDFIDLLNGNFEYKSGFRPIRYKDEVLVGRNTNPKASEDKRDIFIANIRNFKNLKELSNYGRPYYLNLNDLFIHYNELKRAERYNKNNNNDQLNNQRLFFILSAYALFIAIKKHSKSNGRRLPLIFAHISIDKKQSDTTYMFWDTARTIARTMQLPLQTFNDLRESEITSPLGGGLGQLLLSATKNIRQVEMKWHIKDLHLSQQWDNNSLTVYIILEHKTSKLFEKGLVAHFYEIYELTLHKKVDNIIDVNVKLWRDKGTNRGTIFSFPWDKSTVREINEVINKLKTENKASYIFFLSQDKDILSQKIDNAYKVFVRSITTPLLSDKQAKVSRKRNGTDALVLYTKELAKFTEIVKDNLTKAVLGIHSIIPESFISKKSKNKQNTQANDENNNESTNGQQAKYQKFERIIGTSTFLFWVDETMYDNPADIDLFVISAMSWLIFESDSGSHPYATPKWLKRKNRYQLRIPVFLESSRISQRISFDTTTLILELSELVMNVYEGVRR